jgi:hypothetical protein
MEAKNNTTTTGAMPTTVAELQSTTLPNGAIIYFERKQGAEVAQLLEDANTCESYKRMYELVSKAKERYQDSNRNLKEMHENAVNECVRLTKVLIEKDDVVNDVFSFSVDTVKYQIDTFRMKWAFGKIEDHRNEDLNPLLSAYVDLQRLFNACNKVTVDNGLDAELSYSVGVCTDIAELLLSLARNVVKP